MVCGFVSGALALLVLATAPAALADGGYDLVTQWGHAGGFTPSAIAVDNATDVYVLNANRVQKFAGNGAFETQWGSSGSADGAFGAASGLAVDASDNVYVADTGNSRIEKFDRNGGYETQWGSVGSATGHLDHPQGVAVDQFGTVYVADTNNHRIDKFGSNGAYLGSWAITLGNIPTTLAVDGSGHVYVGEIGLDPINRMIERFDASGTPVPAGPGPPGAGPGFFSQIGACIPIRVAVDRTGNVLMLGNATVIKLSPDAILETRWGSAGTGDGQFGVSPNPAGGVCAISGLPEDAGPTAAAVDASGAVYVSDPYNQRIQKFRLAPGSAAPANTVSPKVSGSITVGATLHCSPGSWTGAPPPTLSYRWLLNGVPSFLPGAMTSSLTLTTSAAYYSKAACRVIATNAAGAAVATSASLTKTPVTRQHGQPAASFSTPSKGQAAVVVSLKGAFTLPHTAVKCISGGHTCRMTATVTGRVAAAAGKFRTVTLAAQTRYVPASRTARIKLRLSRQGLTLLNRNRVLRGTVTLTVTRSGATRARAIVNVTLRAHR